MRERAAEGVRLRVLSEEYGVGVNVVSNVVRGLSYAKVGGTISASRRKPLQAVADESGCVLASQSSSRHRRRAYIRVHGDVDKSERVENTCGNALCVNPEHLCRALDLRRPLTPDLARDMRAAYRRSPRSFARMGQEYGISSYRAWFVLTSPKVDGLGEPPIPVRSRREVQP
jgi:hypothetical protein